MAVFKVKVLNDIFHMTIWHQNCLKWHSCGQRGTSSIPTRHATLYKVFTIQNHFSTSELLYEKDRSHHKTV